MKISPATTRIGIIGIHQGLPPPQKTKEDKNQDGTAQHNQDQIEIEIAIGTDAAAIHKAIGVRIIGDTDRHFLSLVQACAPGMVVLPAVNHEGLRFLSII